MPEGWLSAGSHHRCSSSPASRAQAGCSAWSLHRYADLYNDDDKKKQNVDTRYLKFFIKSPTIFDFIKKKKQKKNNCIGFIRTKNAKHSSWVGRSTNLWYEHTSGQRIRSIYTLIQSMPTFSQSRTHAKFQFQPSFVHLCFLVSCWVRVTKGFQDFCKLFIRSNLG